MSLDPSDDRAALAILAKHGISHDRGRIEIPPGEHPDEVWEAIDLLAGEWDYDWVKLKPEQPA